MKKIIYYTDTPQLGGAENQLFLLSKFLNKEKFLPILIISNYSHFNKYISKFEKEGIKTYKINVLHKHDPRHFFQLRDIIKKEKPDLIHLQLWNPASNRYAFLASDKTPIITTEHDPFKLSYLKKQIKKRSLKKVAKIITVSEENKKLMTNLYPEIEEKIEIVHNGIDTTLWKNQILRFTEEERDEIKENLFRAKKDTFIILTVAELHERKGQKYLINAIPEVITKYPNVKFVFAGDGKEKENYQKQIKNLNIERNAILIGKQSNIAKIFKSSDLFVLPSLREAFGLVNVEAMLTPLAVIASIKGGIPEIVKDKETGILVQSKSSKALSNAILKLISNPEKRLEMAKNGYLRASKFFDAKIMSEKHEEIYNKTIENAERKIDI